MLDIRHIIPTPEAEDFMIGMSSKDKDEKTVQSAKKKRENCGRISGS